MPLIAENEYTFTSSDRLTQIHVKEWIPDCDINGVVQISHGISEYIDRYADFARYLASKGFVVVGNDHLGHGESIMSPNEQGFFAATDGWQKVVGDIEKLRQHTARKWPEAPYFMMGHSMGSFLIRTYLARFPDAPLAGAIISGTGQPPMPVLAAGRMLCDGFILRKGPKYRSSEVAAVAFGSYNKGFDPARTKYDWLTRDEAIVDTYAADPLCTLTPTVSLFRDMMCGLTIVGSKKTIDKMNKSLPVYFMSGEKDPVGGNGVQVAKVYSMFVRAGMQDVFYKFYPDGRHEMLNETNRQEVYEDVLKWLFEKID